MNPLPLGLKIYSVYLHFLFSEQIQVTNACFPSADTLTVTHSVSRRRVNRRLVLQGGAAAKPSHIHISCMCVQLGNIVWPQPERFSCFAKSIRAEKCTGGAKTPTQRPLTRQAYPRQTRSRQKWSQQRRQAVSSCSWKPPDFICGNPTAARLATLQSNRRTPDSSRS